MAEPLLPPFSAPPNYAQSGTSATDVMWDLPTGALSETIPRNFTSASQGVLSTGRLTLVGIPLRGGTTVSTITFVSHSQALVTGSNQWFALYSAARAKLGVTNDDTNTAWAAFTAKTLTLATPYAVTASGLYYVGICVVASTVPTLIGGTLTSTITALPPITCGSSDSSLTNPASAPATAAALTALGSTVYAYVS